MMADNNNNERVKKISYSMLDLRDITDDELVEITELSVLNVVREGEPIPHNKPLSPRVGLCTNMTELTLFNCCSFPPDISNCTLLSKFILTSVPGNDDDDCRIDLPEGIVFQNLTSVYIQGGGDWNAGEIVSWLATCSPNLRELHFYDLTKDTANQFIMLLKNNEEFYNKFKDELRYISFSNCNLNQDDARTIIVDIKPLYPQLISMDLKNNNIESLETIGTAMREAPPANNNPLPSKLVGLFLGGNPFSRNLNDPESSDHATMILLLKYHERLVLITNSNDKNFTYSSLIDYWVMMNASKLRYLLDDGHGGIRLSGILPYVMTHAYENSRQDEQRGQDPTTIFNLLREGPIFRIHEL